MALISTAFLAMKTTSSWKRRSGRTNWKGRSSSRVPESYVFGDSVVVPLKAGETLKWKCLSFVCS